MCVLKLMCAQQLLGLVVAGSNSGWWGLGCPAHCSSSITLSLVTFAAGFGFGALSVLDLFRGQLLVQPSPVHCPASASSGQPTGNPRLRAYLHG